MNGEYLLAIHLCIGTCTTQLAGGGVNYDDVARGIVLLEGGPRGLCSSTIS